MRKLALVMILTVPSFQKIAAKLIFQFYVIRQDFLAFLIAITVYQQSRAWLLYRVPYSYHKICNKYYINFQPFKYNPTPSFFYTLQILAPLSINLIFFYQLFLFFCGFS